MCAYYRRHQRVCSKRTSRYYWVCPIAESLGNSVEFFEADVSDEEQIRSSIEHTKKELGKIDVLFNNAGGPADAPLDQITQEDRYFYRASCSAHAT